MDAILGIDIGASGGKAFLGLIDEKDGVLRLRLVNRFDNGMIKVKGHLYWDILALWGEVKRSIKAAYRESGSGLRSVGVDTWGVDFALLDEKGELVGLPYAYRDPMTEGAMDEVLRIIPREVIYARTGIQFMRINTIYQLYALAKLNPAKLKLARTFLMIPDLINHWLSGKASVEYTNATTTQLLDARSRNWCLDIIESIGVPSSIFPRVVEPGTVLGNVDAALLEELDIPRNSGILTIAPATHDTASAIAAAPMVRPGIGYISSGTWNLVGVELREPLINQDALRSNFTNEGGAFGTITFLRNAQGMWIIQEVKRVIEDREGRQYTYDELVKLAQEASDIGSFIDFDEPRFLAPQNMVEEIMRYLDETNQRRPGSLGELIRMILLNLAFKHRYILEMASRLTGIKITGINIFGGGSRNSLLDQFTADVMGVTVYAGPEEATAIGNIMVQAYALGIVKSHSEARELVRRSVEVRVFEPSSNSGRYMDMYEDYLSWLSKRMSS